jgi:hypothetical protein
VRTRAERESQRAISGWADRPAASCRTKGSLSSREGSAACGAEDEEENGEEADRHDGDRGQREGEEETLPCWFGPVGVDRLLVLLPARGLEVEIVQIVGHVALRFQRKPRRRERQPASGYRRPPPGMGDDVPGVPAGAHEDGERAR